MQIPKNISPGLIHDNINHIQSFPGKNQVIHAPLVIRDKLLIEHKHKKIIYSLVLAVKYYNYTNHKSPTFDYKNFKVRHYPTSSWPKYKIFFLLD